VKLSHKIPENLIWALLYIGRAFWAIVYALATLAFIDRRLRPWWFFSIALFAINALLSGGINPVGTDMSRYTQPLYVFLFVFAGVGAKWLLDRAKGNGGEERRRGDEWEGAHAGAQ